MGARRSAVVLPLASLSCRENDICYGVGLRAFVRIARLPLPAIPGAATGALCT